jgi:hypothetical protein
LRWRNQTDQGKSQGKITPKPQSLQAIPTRTHAILATKRCSNYAAAFQISSTDTA